MIAPRTYLVAGESLGELARSRAHLVSHMAADLMETGNFTSHNEAVRQLHRDGYGVVDIMILVDDARQYAHTQAVVARAMEDTPC